VIARVERRDGRARPDGAHEEQAEQPLLGLALPASPQRRLMPRRIVGKKTAARSRSDGGSVMVESGPWWRTGSPSERAPAVERTSRSARTRANPSAGYPAASRA
jgi:hypothetical protein